MGINGISFNALPDRPVSYPFVQPVNPTMTQSVFAPSLYKACILLTLLISACSQQPDSELSVDYEKYVLENGLEVILHIDRSDPIAAVAMTYHVGSARELKGRTGFAHLFEHLLFLESENLGKGGLDILINKVGGSLNGSTSRDRTNYYQVVPNDALEKIIWAEADKMGFFINTVTESVLEKEKQVVKNEKRQSVDNRPYGHTQYVIGKNLFPEDHPYNWQVIGSLEDLDRAELQDVKDFYNNWYGPNNATLVIAGDIDVEQTKEWVEKYFGEFESRGDVTPLAPQAASLEESRHLVHEDNFAQLPALTMVWPTVEEFHPDSYALDMLAELLASGKNSPFYKVLVEDEKLTSDVSMFFWPSELAGRMQLTVRAFPETSLDSLKLAVDQAFHKFEKEGIKEKDLKRIKAGQETTFYRGLSSVLGKAFQLAHYNIFADDPGFASKEIDAILAVSEEDVLRVYNTYIKDKAYVATSFVPKGQSELAISGSAIAEVVEEPIVQGAEAEFELSENEEGYPKTPSKVDRSEPPFGETPEVNVPPIWTATLDNGMRVFGIENDETPLVQFSFRIEGGLYFEDPNRVGVSNLLAEMLMAGTQSKTPTELEEAIEQLGATLSIDANREAVVIEGTTLAKNYDAMMALVEEILLEPRWDETEFDIIKQRTLNQLRQQKASPPAIASNAFNTLIYGKDHIFSKNLLGSLSSVEAITMDDLKAYYQSRLSPSGTDMHIAGFVNQNEALLPLDGIVNRWEAVSVEKPEYELPPAVESSSVYFVDVPNAKQSVLRVGYLGLKETDPDFLSANAMNFKLGGGGFSSELLQVLREEKGYTYGAGSRFLGSSVPGPYQFSSNVRSNVTLESLQLVKDIIGTYESDYSESYLADTKSFMIKSNARRFETLGAKLGILEKISAYDWDFDYPKQQEQVIKDLTVADMKRLANKYIDVNKMIFLVVGDAETQMPRLTELGFGEPVLLPGE